MTVILLASPSHAAETREQAGFAFEALRKEKWALAVAHARQSGDPMVGALAEWYRLTRDPQIAEFTQYQRFLSAYPDWPERRKLLLRAELALLDGAYDRDTTLRWFTAHPPQTAEGKFRLAELTGRVSPVVVAHAWAEDDFPPEEEKRIRATYGKWLTAKEYAARAGRLLWEGNLKEARALLPKLSAEDRALLDARIALREGRAGVNGLLAKLPARLQSDPGLLFDRLQYRAARKVKDGVLEILLKAPAEVPYPEQWWPYRKAAIREALEARDYALAEQLAVNHGQKDTLPLSEALWLKGWIQLVFRDRPKQALVAFTQLYNTVSTPVSQARGAYWAGRAAKALGDSEGARAWFDKAAVYNATFYGQLALEEQSDNATLALPGEPSVSPEEWKRYVKDDPLARLILLMGDSGAADLAVPLLKHAAAAARMEKDTALVARLGSAMGRPDLSVRAAKEAYQQQTRLLPEFAYPVYSLPEDITLESALVHGFARQESMFYPAAKSSSGALGLMQLLPGTAKHMATRYGFPFAKSRLVESHYNIRLGNLYLEELIAKFQGSYVLAAAAYNAGPSRAVAWERKFGTPGGNLYQTINWIEIIPYEETRNYVQRVLENYQVYRARMAGGKATLTANDMLVR